MAIRYLKRVNCPDCGVQPVIDCVYLHFEDLCRYVCPICGRSTDLYEMPWQATDAWNEGKIDKSIICQMRLFDE